MIKYLRYCLLLLVVVTASLKGYSNAIDSIQTKGDVVRFLKSNLIRIAPDHLYYPGMDDTFNVSYIDTNADFCKADIEGKGKTDLIIGGRWSTVIMDAGGKYTAYPLEIRVFISGIPYFFEKVIELPGHSTALLCRHEVEKYWESSKTVVHDTLVFKFNDFIEYHLPYVHPGISKIDLLDEPGGMSTVSESYIEISSDGAALYTPSRNYGSHASGENLLFGIDSNQLTELWSLLTYIDPASLKDKYGYYQVSDEHTAILNIHFDDGTIKKIEDYALAGSLGLRALYNKIFAIQQSQH